MFMRSRHPITRPVACLLIFVFCYFNVLWAPAQAALVSTDQVVQEIAEEQTRARLRALLARADVKTQLEAWGVDPLEAQTRVDTLTAEELETLSARMDELPAGGSGLAVVAVVLLIAFLIILLTDIMGYTDIFTFTR
jgi:F0F1-type ATP synthase membrane subunit b/b'